MHTAHDVLLSLGLMDVVSEGRRDNMMTEDWMLGYNSVICDKFVGSDESSASYLSLSVA